MRAVIHTSELVKWQERANRNEILISGMTFPHKGKVELDYTETPALIYEKLNDIPHETPNMTKTVNKSEMRALAGKSGNSQSCGTILAHGTTSPSLSPAPAAVPSPAAVRPLLIECDVCHLEIEQGKPCRFCAALENIKHGAERNRRNYALDKRFNNQK